MSSAVDASSYEKPRYHVTAAQLRDTRVVLFIYLFTRF
jgi:hypothetical protein